MPYPCVHRYVGPAHELQKPYRNLRPGRRVPKYCGDAHNLQFFRFKGQTDSQGVICIVSYIRVNDYLNLIHILLLFHNSPHSAYLLQSFHSFIPDVLIPIL